MKRNEIPLNQNLVRGSLGSGVIPRQMKGVLNAYDRITCTLRYYTNHKGYYPREKTLTLTNITYFDFLQRAHGGHSDYFIDDFKVTKLVDE